MAQDLTQGGKMDDSHDILAAGSQSAWHPPYGRTAKGIAEPSGLRQVVRNSRS
jgi:hypothetical protein